MTLNDTNRFLYASIREVIWSLAIAVILVVLVVYLFLQDIRATLIPTLAIFVSVIGTFGFMAIAGFSINLLTLFALVLAIGTVVDNAIIVVEAVQARFESGYKSSYMATNDAMGGITSAIVVSTIIFMAVFIPTSMIGGTSGTFYTQYGVLFFIRRRWACVGLVALCLVALFVLMQNTKTGFVPDEDTGTVLVSMNTPAGISLEKTNKIIRDKQARFQSLPEIEYSGGVGGMVVGTLVLLFLVPGLWMIFQSLQEKIRPASDIAEKTDWAIEAEKEYVAEQKKQKE